MIIRRPNGFQRNRLNEIDNRDKSDVWLPQTKNYNNEETLLRKLIYNLKTLRIFLLFNSTILKELTIIMMTPEPN